MGWVRGGRWDRRRFHLAMVYVAACLDNTGRLNSSSIYYTHRGACAR